MKSVIEKLIVFIVMTGYYFIAEENFSIIISLVAFILVFSIELVKVHLKLFTATVIVIMCMLLFTNDVWIYYFPLVAHIVAQIFGDWSLAVLLVYFVYPDWGLCALTLAVIYIAQLNNQIDTVEDENKYIRDQLTKDNLRLRTQHKELMKNHEREVYMAGLNERNRIARDMHDALGHSLSSSILLIESLQYVKDPEQLQKSLKQLQGRLQSGMNDVRTSIHHLYDTSIDLNNRVLEYLNEMTHYSVDYQFQIEVALPHHVKMDILSLVRESLTNIKKHTDATDASEVIVLLREHPDFIVISIKDNGTKYHSNNQGMGLQTMKETVQKYKGVFNTFYDNGFNVHIILYKGEFHHEDRNH